MTEPTWATFEFKRDKFRQLLLYFSKRGRDEGVVIGSTKLNKLLFFADFRTYAELGAPATGARYQRLEYGPAARAMLPVRAELVEDGDAHFDEQPQDELSAVVVPDVEANLDAFTPDERRIADAVFDELCELTTTAASDLSHHRSAGWNVMGDGDDIPYESAFISTDPPPDEAVELGRRLAKQYGW